MKLTEDLPIFRDSYRLSSLIIDFALGYPKLFKYSLGSRMIDLSLALLDYIMLANSSVSNKDLRSRYLLSFLVKFTQLKTLIRMSAEKRILSFKQLALLAPLTESIGKQATAWKNR